MFSCGMLLGKNIISPAVSEKLEDILVSSTHQSKNHNDALLRGIGIGIGSQFTNIDVDTQLKIIQIANRYPRFAGFLGYELGKRFNSIEKTIQNSLFELSIKNYTFMFTMFSGLSHIFSLLDIETQREIWGLALRDRQVLVEILGYGIGKSLPFLSNMEAEEVLDVAIDQQKVAESVGYGVGQVFGYLNDNRVNQVRTMIYFSNNNFFSKQHGRRFSLYMGYGIGSILPSDKKLEEELLNVARLHISCMFAIGFHKGLQYGTLELHDRIIELRRATSSLQYAVSFGKGVGTAFPSMDKNRRKEIWSLADEKSDFARDLSFPIGEIFAFLDENLQKEIWDFAKTNLDFSKYLAYGLGKSLPLLSNDMQDEVLDMIDTTNQYTNSLGYGIGRSIHKFLDSELRQKIWKYAKINRSFANYLSLGLDTSYPFAERIIQEEVWNIALETKWFSKHFFKCVGKILSSLDLSLQISIIHHINENKTMWEDLAGGVAFSFNSLNQQHQETLLNLAISNIQIGQEFARGIGNAFPQIDEKYCKDIQKMAKSNDVFADKLGHGIGEFFVYFDHEFQKKIFQLEIHDKFDEALGNLIGEYLYSFENYHFVLTEKNSFSYIRGLIKGISKIFSFLDPKVQNYVIQVLGDHKDFHRPSSGYSLPSQIEYNEEHEPALVELKEFFFSLRNYLKNNPIPNTDRTLIY